MKKKTSDWIELQENITTCNHSVAVYHRRGTVIMSTVLRDLVTPQLKGEIFTGALTASSVPSSRQIFTYKLPKQLLILGIAL